MKKNSQGYYEKRINLGRDPITGAYIRKAIRARSVRELERKVFDFKQELKVRAPAADSDMIFETYSKRWMLSKANLSINTKNMYRLILDKHVLPEIGAYYFSEITFDMVQMIIHKNFVHYNTCTKILLTLRQIFEAATVDGLVSNPIQFKRIVMPKKVKKVDKRALTEEEKKAVALVELPPKEKAFLYILYYTGLRREEALGLLPESFDFEKRTVTVSRTVVFDKNQSVVNEGSAKNTYSLRSVPLPAPCIEVLKEYVSGCSGYLFRSERSDTPFSKTAYRLFFTRIRNKLAEIAPSASELTAHMFRHNYATQLYYSNITLKMAARLLGHSDTTMITRVYAHLDEQKEQVAAKLDSVFSV